MSKDLPCFSVSQYTTYPLSFEQDVALYHRLGVRGVEVAEEKLSAEPVKARRQLAMLAENGLQVTSVQPQVLSLFPHELDKDETSVPQDPEQRIVRYRQSIDLFSTSFPGQDVPLVIGGGRAPQYNFRLAHETARRLWPPLADYAADRGVRLMFEPLSPILMNAFTFITTLDEAMQLIDDIDRPNFGLALDVWHLWREPSITERIALLGDRIFGVHVCDWPVGEPRGPADRVLPGTGLIDLSAMLGAIEQAGYSGAYCLEIFSDENLPGSLWRGDSAETIERGRNGFFQAWRNRRGLKTDGSR